MQIYHYDGTTSIYLGPGYADPDPIENPDGDINGVWLIPANSTSIAPPAEAEGNLRIFRDGAWGYVAIDSPGDNPQLEPLPPSATDVDLERDRRISAGFTFGGAFYQSRPQDRENIMGASTAALAAMISGAQPGDYRWDGENSDFQWIDASNATHPMDAQTMFALGKAAMAHKQAHIFAARAIKDMSPIPADFATNPAYWPSVV